MSGACCPDCGEYWLEGPPDRATCAICGWTGDTGPLGRSWPVDDPDAPDLRALKLAGKLYFVKIRFDEKLNEDVVFDVMEVLGLDGASHSGGRMILQLPARPDDATLGRLRAVKGVLDLSVT